MRFRLALALLAAASAAEAQQPDAPHRLAVKPEYGAWMVCVKSYVGPTAAADAEEFARFVQAKYNAAAFLYERGREERLAQEARRDQIRRERTAEVQPFLALQAKLKADAERAGTPFVPAPVKISVPEVTAKTQWAVLVGGWKDMDTAAGALKTIRQWKELPDERLLDRATVSGGSAGARGQYVNPFAVALVCPNPSVAKPKPGEVPLDPLVIKLNENEPLSVLKIGKKWTLTVKDFPVPTTTEQQGQEGTLIGRALGLSDEGKYLERTAADATEFAKMLRGKPMQDAATQAAQKLGMSGVALDSYVLAPAHRQPRHRRAVRQHRRPGPGADAADADQHELFGGAGAERPAAAGAAYFQQRHADARPASEMTRSERATPHAD